MEVVAPLAISRQYQFGTAAFSPQWQPERVGLDHRGGGPGRRGRPLDDRWLLDLHQRRRDCRQHRTGRARHVRFRGEGPKRHQRRRERRHHLQQPGKCGGSPPGMAEDGINGPLVTVPTSASIAPTVSRWSGVGPVMANIGVDPTIRAGADHLGRARLYAVFRLRPARRCHTRHHCEAQPADGTGDQPDLTHNVKAPDDLTLESSATSRVADADLDGVRTRPTATESDLTATIVVGDIAPTCPTRCSAAAARFGLIAEIKATTTARARSSAAWPRCEQPGQFRPDYPSADGRRHGGGRGVEEDHLAYVSLWVFGLLGLPLRVASPAGRRPPSSRS